MPTQPKNTGGTCLLLCGQYWREDNPRKIRPWSSSSPRMRFQKQEVGEEWVSENFLKPQNVQNRYLGIVIKFQNILLTLFIPGGSEAQGSEKGFSKIV